MPLTLTIQEAPGQARGGQGRGRGGGQGVGQGVRISFGESQSGQGAERLVLQDGRLVKQDGQHHQQQHQHQRHQHQEGGGRVHLLTTPQATQRSTSPVSFSFRQNPNNSGMEVSIQPESPSSPGSAISFSHGSTQVHRNIPGAVSFSFRSQQPAAMVLNSPSPIQDRPMVTYHRQESCPSPHPEPLETYKSVALLNSPTSSGRSSLAKDTGYASDDNMSQTYRSEIFIPIRKDELSFEDRQRHLWQEMDTRMEQRRVEWEQEIGRMRKEFFSLKPMDMSSRMGTERVDNLQTAFVQDHDGIPKFKVRFDVHEFKTEEITVQTYEKRLVVRAQHTEKRGNTTMSREFSRQIDLPGSVDSKQLQASVTKDGVLIVEAPVPVPQYQAVTSSPFNPPAIRGSPGPGPVITLPDGSRQLRLEVDIGTQYVAEEVVVKTIDRKIVISARHEEKFGNRSSFSEFSKEYELPESVDPFTVNAYLLDNGKLVVEAPMQSQMSPPPPPPRSQRIVINVQRH